MDGRKGIGSLLIEPRWLFRFAHWGERKDAEQGGKGGKGAKSNEKGKACPEPKRLAESGGCFGPFRMIEGFSRPESKFLRIKSLSAHGVPPFSGRGHHMKHKHDATSPGVGGRRSANRLPKTYIFLVLWRIACPLPE